MKNKVFNSLMAGALVLSALINPSGVFATNSNDDEEIIDTNENVEELSGVSIEQMQDDFTNVAGSNTSSRKARSVSIEESSTASTYNVDFSKFVFLSDIEYDHELSNTEWKEIKKDANTDGVQIRLKKNGEVVTFPKGMGAHATSNLVYDISDYSDKYTRLSTYLGVDYAQSGKGNGVKFSIFTSQDKNDWHLVETTDVLLPANDCKYINIDVKNVKYIKLYADSVNNNRSNDHAVYGDLRLVEEGYDINSETNYTGFKTLTQYDEIISKRSIEDNFNNHKTEILEREFVNRVGYDNIIRAARYIDGVADALDWLKKDNQALQLFIEAGGYFSGSGYNAIVALGRLYKNYHEDMDNLIYKKMLLATAAGYSKNIKTFLVNYGGNAIESDPVLKYQYFKKLYDTNQFIRKEEFEGYSMELVRAVMDSRINDAEIFWLRDYIEKKYPADKYLTNWVRFNGYGYSKYVNTGYDTKNKPQFYDEAYKDKWNQTYGFLDYDISYGEANLYRIWMFMEAGAICWGLSGIGMVVNEVQGIPAIGTYQPGHEAYLLYSTNNQGKGIWAISDNIGGWQGSFSRWGGTTATEHRLMLGWGQKEYNTLNSGNNTSYTLLAQDALNDYSNYLNSMFYNLIANSYEIGTTDHENALNKSLSCYSKNLDSIYGLYKSYLSKQTTTDQQWLELARKIAKEYMYFPAPMVDLLKLIRPQIETEVLQIEVDMLQTESLKNASVATAAQSLQDSACREIAKSLLGKNAVDLATFSFDGDNANIIVIDDSYADSTIQVRVSFDGGVNWEKFDGDSIFTTDHRIELTDEQINKISAEKDIYVGLMGTDKNFVIDIKEGSAVSSSIYLNDNENRLIGAGNALEYSKNGKWYPLDSTIRFTGDTTVTVRNRKTGTTLAGPSKEFTFSQDTDTTKQKYVTIDRVIYVGCSSEQANQGGSAKNAFDGNLNTMWHTLWNGSDKERYIIAKFDQPLYLSGLGYIKNGGGNGTFVDTEVYTSLDGKNWTLSASAKGWGNNSLRKKLDFDKPVYTEYVKIKAVTGMAGFAAASMIDFYEDTEMAKKEIVGLELVKQPIQSFDEYTYYDNEAIDISGMVINAVYDDGSKLAVNNQILEMDQKYASVSNPVITFTHKVFNNAKISIPIKVSQMPQEDAVVGISIEKMPEKLTYLTGDRLDTTGMIVVKEYSSGRKTIIDDYQISNDTLDETGNMSINLAYGDFTTSYTVTVLKRPVSLKIVQKPTKVQYALGETFNATNLKILETYQDESTKELNLTEINKYYTIKSQNFSNTAGTKTIAIVNNYDNAIQTSFDVTVKPQFTYKELEFEAFENSNNSYVSGVNSRLVSKNKQIIIPDTVKVGNLTFNVTQIASSSTSDKGAFANQEVRSIVMPASINTICNNAFENLTDVNLYFTAHDDFSNLVVEENAFISDQDEPVYGRVYVNSTELAKQLEQQIASGKASGLKNFTICTYDETIALLEVTPVDKLTYQLGESLDMTGFEVVALMRNGQRIKLNPSIYQMSEFDSLKAGKQEITVTVEDISESFEVTVIPAAPTITKQPKGVVYDGLESVTLDVEAVVSDQGTLYYQWYSGEENSYDLQPIKNATSPSLTVRPDDTKFYYVEVTNNDSQNSEDAGTITRSNIVAVSYSGDNEAAVDGLAYSKLKDAVDAANSGQVVEVLNDVAVDNTISINKNITLNGNNHTLTRVSGFRNEFINLASGNLTINALTFDGGAIWEGTINENLNRSTTNKGLSADRPLIIQQNGKIILNDSKLQNNQGANNYGYAGGAIKINNGEINLNTTDILNCETVYGGAILSLNRSVIKFNSGTISQNRATASGGVFCVDNYSQVIMNGGTIDHNLANSGGVFWVSHGSIELNSGEIISNRTNNDGTVYTSGSGTINLKNTSFKNNNAPKGKAVNFYNGALKISGEMNLNDQDIYRANNKVIEITADISTLTPINIVNNTYSEGSAFVKAASQEIAQKAIDAFVVKNGEKVYDIYQDNLNLKYGTIARIEVTNELSNHKVVKNTNLKLNVEAAITNGVNANLTYQWYASKNSDGSEAIELTGDSSINIAKALNKGTWYVWCKVSSDAGASETIKTNLAQLEITPFYPASKLIDKIKNK